jgi:hypothetical protein
MRKFLSLGALALLAGCAYPSPQHVQALNSMVGKPEVDVVRTYGVPNRTIDTSGHRFLAYSESRIDSLGYPGWGYGGCGWGRWGGFYGGGFGDEIVQEQCTTTFELANGLVQSWKLKGNDC